ncbi:MAG: hypothetical protein GF335_00480 [Candidatus Moranbacteria bacterium]|nr:hypothetical protein [Candidatus Moranbacteria bacterium]
MSIFERIGLGSKEKTNYLKNINEIKKEIKQHPLSKQGAFGYFYKYAEHSEPGRFFVSKLKDISNITKKYLNQKIKDEKLNHKESKGPLSKLRLQEKIKRLKLDKKHGFSEKYKQMQVLKEQNALPFFAKDILEMKKLPSAASANTLKDVEEKAEMLANHLLEDKKNKDSFEYQKAKQDYANQIKFVLKLKIINSLGKNNQYDLMQEKNPTEGLKEKKFNQIKQLLIAEEVGSFDEGYKVDPQFANAALKNPDLFYENLMKIEQNDIKRGEILIKNGSPSAIAFFQRHPKIACAAMFLAAPAIIYAHAKLSDDPYKGEVTKRSSNPPKPAGQNLSPEELEELKSSKSKETPTDHRINQEKSMGQEERKELSKPQKSMPGEALNRDQKLKNTQTKKPIEAQNKGKKPESKKMTWEEIVDYLQEKVGLDLSQKTPETRKLYSALKTGNYKITGAKKLGENAFWIILTNKKDKKELNIAFNQRGGSTREEVFGEDLGGLERGEGGGVIESSLIPLRDPFQKPQTKSELESYAYDQRNIGDYTRETLIALQEKGFLPSLDDYDYNNETNRAIFTNRKDPSKKIQVFGNQARYFQDGEEVFLRYLTSNGRWRVRETGF